MPREISLPVDVDSLSSSLLGTFFSWGVSLHCSQQEITKDHQILRRGPNAPCSLSFPHQAGKWMNNAGNN